jgi:hypothetical protein
VRHRFSNSGKVLQAPIPLPDVKSPDYPLDYPAPLRGPANLASSNGAPQARLRGRPYNDVIVVRLPHLKLE